MREMLTISTWERVLRKITEHEVVENQYQEHVQQQALVLLVTNPRVLLPELVVTY